VDSVEERIARLEERVATMGASLEEIKGVVCQVKSIGSLVKEPQTLIVIFAVWLASAGGQSFQHLIDLGGATP
jgi:hypothetical protein